MRRHFVSECQTSACVCVCVRVCVCEWRKILFDLRVMLPCTHAHTQTQLCRHTVPTVWYYICHANAFNLANPSIFKDHEGNSMTKKQLLPTCWQIKRAPNAKNDASSWGWGCREPPASCLVPPLQLQLEANSTWAADWGSLRVCVAVCVAATLSVSVAVECTLKLT